MKIELPEIWPEERTPLVEALLGIIQQLADRVAELEETNRHMRDQVAVLQGQQPRPTIRPSILSRTLRKSNVPKREGENEFDNLNGAAPRLFRVVTKPSRTCKYDGSH